MPSHLQGNCIGLCVFIYLCEVSTRVLPLSRTLARVFQRSRLAAGSIPVVGSSRKMILGLPVRATAVLSLRRLPPLRHNDNSNRVNSNKPIWDQYSHMGLVWSPYGSHHMPMEMLAGLKYNTIQQSRISRIQCN